MNTGVGKLHHNVMYYLQTWAAVTFESVSAWSLSFPKRTEYLLLWETFLLTPLELWGPGVVPGPRWGFLIPGHGDKIWVLEPKDWGIGDFELEFSLGGAQVWGQGRTEACSRTSTSLQDSPRPPPREHPLEHICIRGKSKHCELFFPPL